jgi:hypothetical protein
MSERSVADPRLFAADYCLSGPVRTLVHRFGPTGHVTEREVAFRPTGEVSSAREATALPRGGSRRSSVEYVYGPDAKLRERVRTSEGGVPRRTRYEYDDRGRLVRVWADHAGRSAITQTVEFRPDGAASRHDILPALAPGVRVSHIVPNGRMGYSAPGITEIRTEYDPSGIPHWSVMLAPPPHRSFSVLSRYQGPEALLVEEFRAELRAADLPAPGSDWRWPGAQISARLRREDAISSAKYEYDAAHRCVHRVVNLGPLLVEETWTEFDSQGNPVLERTRSEEGPETLVRTEYGYDPSGNWVRKVARQERPGGEAAFVSGEERTITYY